jgi:mono/diheme cytochrome c family protein
MRLQFVTGAAVLFGLLAACAYEAPPEFTEPQTLGGEVVSSEVLNEGQEAYAFYCLSCHGRNGDGRGISAAGLMVPPRDFRVASFKFGGVVEGLPHDEDLVRVVRHGLAGTAMLPWEVTDTKLHAIIQYIKTFSPPDEGWRDPEEEKGERVVAGPNPWEGNEKAARSRGEEVFHGKASCNTCHPTYVDKREALQYRKEASSGTDGAVELRAQPWLSVPQLSVMYSRPIAGDPACSDDAACGLGNTCRFGRCEEGLRILPPDFTVNLIKNGTELPGLFSILSTGVPGTAMPAWKGTIPDKDIWALAHYVRHLATMETDKAREHRDRVRSSLERE